MHNSLHLSPPSRVKQERNKIREAGGNREAMTAKSDEINAKMDAELKPILGEATYNKYIAIATEKRAVGGARGQRPAVNP